MPFTSQLWRVTQRVFQQYWREPIYIWAKLILAIASSLFIGFTFFKPSSSQQGFQDVLFSAFMLTSIFSTLVQQSVFLALLNQNHPFTNQQSQDNAQVRHPTLPIRSSRKTLQGLLLGRLHHS
jgi:ABC-type multidrug transport system permease subunit